MKSAHFVRGISFLRNQRLLMPRIFSVVFVAGVLALLPAPRAPCGHPGEPKAGPPPASRPLPAPRPLSAPPAEPRDAAGLVPAKLEEADRELPINLATALRLADARPLIIESARAAIETQAGLYEQARALWLPTVYLGVDYQRHDGGQLDFFNGAQILGARNQFLVGGGARAVFALPDAIYAPLAARQVLQARNIDVQTAKNDALLSVAVAYFDVQQARGILAGSQDVVIKARELARRVSTL